MIIFSPVANVRAAEYTGLSQTMSTNIFVKPRTDVIVRKYRTIYGVLQYRRWNETRGVWVDDDWITIS